MKLILTVILSIFTLSVSGQVKPKVIYKKAEKTNKQAASYINGKFIGAAGSIAIDNRFIDDVHVEKVDIEIEGTKYYGQIFVTVKAEYNPKLISLNTLKSKYTNLIDDNSIFMVDDKIIRSSYDKFMVDENFIIKIVVEEVEVNSLNFNIIRLSTRSETNVKGAEEIYIR